MGLRVKSNIVSHDIEYILIYELVKIYYLQNGIHKFIYHGKIHFKNCYKLLCEVKQVVVV